ncbi:MAG: L-dopachrome tautomerase-related protein [Pseudomonadota bacterium]
MFRWIKRIFLALALLIAGLIGFLYYHFGGGKPYVDLTTAPLLPQGTIEVAVTSDRPIGNATVSADGRIFYTIHPESNPTGPKLYEWVDGKAVPYPNPEEQESFFETPLGVVVDARERLWVMDPGTHGTGTPSLTAFDLETDELVHRREFSSDVAPIGSFLQDMQVSTDGKWVYIADVGFWAKRPGIVVYNTETQKSWRVFDRHESVYPQNILIRTQIKDMAFFGGLLEMKTGIDGIALSRDNRWLYYGTMNHDTLYRLPVSVLQQESATDTEVEEVLEAVGKKPLNDGLSIDDQNNVFITDIEYQAVLKMAPDGTLTTVVKDDRIRWADGLSFGPDGWLYLADSAIPHIVLQNAEHHQANAPYYIWRFKPGTRGAAGQ